MRKAPNASVCKERWGYWRRSAAKGVKIISPLVISLTADELIELLRTQTFDQRSFTIMVGGCFDYTFVSGEGGHHQTRFIYDLARKDHRVFFIEEQTTAIEMLRLEPWAGVGDGFYAD